MRREYTIALRYNKIPLYLFRDTFKDYLNSLDLFVAKKTFMKGIDSLPTLYTESKEGDEISFRQRSFAITNEFFEELEAIKYAFMIAKKLEATKLQFRPRLVFNPNFIIYLFSKSHSDRIRINLNDFMPDAKNLQNILYGGGKIAYIASAGDFRVYLGVKIEDKTKNKLINIVENEGIAKPVASLDELLVRIKQKRT